MTRNPAPLELEDLPEKEGVSKADVSERLEKDPEEQKNLNESVTPEDT